MKYAGKKVAILGFGVEGRAALDYWGKAGAKVTIHDGNSELKLPPGIQGVLGDEYLNNLDSYDLIVRSPGVFPYKFTTSSAVTSVMNEFLAQCPARTIGVTGTKGKGTTATLIYHILKSAGKKVYLGGNIGKPPLEYLAHLTADDFVVLELSNVQLWDIKHSPQVAVLLMIVPEHLDWHRGDAAEYVATKANVTRYQDSRDLLVFHGTDRHATDIAAQSKAQRLPFFTELPPSTGLDSKAVWVNQKDEFYVAKTYICSSSDITLIGKHNWQNVAAAIGATFGIVKDPESIRGALRTYQPPPHRLQLVGEKDGVKYYDDSIATHELATQAAIASFNEPKVLILGGSEKGGEYKGLARAVKSANVRGIILIGETAPKIAAELKLAGVDAPTQTGLTAMPAVVTAAAEMALSGDVVLLSPACASFGLFTNYQDRGQQFARAVAQLN